MPPRIISVIGTLNADLVMVLDRMPEAGEKLKAHDYYEALGGAGANAAIATYRSCHSKVRENLDALRNTEERPAQEPDGAFAPPADGIDIQVRMTGAVGNDKYAELFQTELKSNGIDTSAVRTIEGHRSGVCHAMVDRYTGEHRLLFHLGANKTWKLEDFLKVEDLANGPTPELVISQLTIGKRVVEQMMETAGKAGVDVLLNSAPADPLTMRSYRYITHLLMNKSESAIMSGRDLDEINQETWQEIAQEFLDRGVKNVVLTLGIEGAYFANALEHGHVPAYKVDVVDVTGSGAAFTGAYASDYVRQKATGVWDIKSAIIRANKAAALAIMKLGAQRGLPWADEIDQFEGELLVSKISEMHFSEAAEEVPKEVEGTKHDPPAIT